MDRAHMAAGFCASSRPPAVEFGRKSVLCAGGFNSAGQVRSAALGINRDRRRLSDDPAGLRDDSHKNCRDCVGDRAVVMMFPSNRVRVLVSTQPIDFRKGHDGLAALVHRVCVPLA